MDSSSVGGSKSRGSVFIRGIKPESGLESFKFCLEKNVDFAELDSAMILNAVEHIFKLNARKNNDEDNESDKRFSARKENKNK